MLRFANSELLALLALLPLIWGIYLIATRNRRRRIARFINPAFASTLIPLMSKGRRALKFALYISALVLVIVAAARPQLGSKLREVKSNGIEMMMLVDVSNSMLAEDFSPSRLDRTKHAISQLTDKLSQERMGLIAFAGEAAVKLPITSDYRMARAQADRLSTTSVARQGTNVTEALNLAMLSFSANSDAGKAIIIITDGENHEEGALEAAQRAAAAGIKIFTIGIGTPEGSLLTINGETVRDENGEMVVTRLDEKFLAELATITDGGYIRASRQDIGLATIVDSINEMERVELSTLSFEEYNEEFPLLLYLALALLLIDLYLRERRNPALSRFNIFREPVE